MQKFINTLNFIANEDDRDKRISQINDRSIVTTQLKINSDERQEVAADIKDTNEIISRLKIMHETAINNMGVQTGKKGGWQFDGSSMVDNDEIQEVAEGYKSHIETEKERYKDKPKVLETLNLLSSQIDNMTPYLVNTNDFNDNLDDIAIKLENAKWTDKATLESLLMNLKTGIQAGIDNNVLNKHEDMYNNKMVDATEQRLFILDTFDRFKQRGPVRDEWGNAIVDSEGKGEYVDLLNDKQFIEANPQTYERVMQIKDLMDRGLEDDAYTLAKDIPSYEQADRDFRVSNADYYLKQEQKAKVKEEELIEKQHRAEQQTLGHSISQYLEKDKDGRSTVGVLHGPLKELQAKYDKITEGAYTPEINQKGMEEAYTLFMNRIDEMESGVSRAQVFEEVPRSGIDKKIDINLNNETKARILTGDVYWNGDQTQLLWTVKGSEVMESGVAKDPIYIDFTSGKKKYVQKNLPKGMEVDESLALDKIALIDWGVDGWQIGPGGVSGTMGDAKVDKSSVQRATQLASRMYLNSLDQYKTKDMSPSALAAFRKNVSYQSNTDDLNKLIISAKENDGVDSDEMSKIKQVVDILGSQGKVEYALDKLKEEGTIGTGDWWLLKDGSVGLTTAEQERLVSFANIRLERNPELKDGLFTVDNFSKDLMDILEILYGDGEYNMKTEQFEEGFKL